MSLLVIVKLCLSVKVSRTVVFPLLIYLLPFSMLDIIPVKRPTRLILSLIKGIVLLLLLGNLSGSVLFASAISPKLL